MLPYIANFKEDFTFTILNNAGQSWIMNHVTQPQWFSSSEWRGFFCHKNLTSSTLADATWPVESWLWRLASSWCKCKPDCFVPNHSQGARLGSCTAASHNLWRHKNSGFASEVPTVDDSSLQHNVITWLWHNSWEERPSGRFWGILLCNAWIAQLHLCNSYCWQKSGSFEIGPHLQATRINIFTQPFGPQMAKCHRKVCLGVTNSTAFCNEILTNGGLLKEKHRKNCECCPVSLLIVRQQRLSWIQVLNCQNCN